MDRLFVLFYMLTLACTNKISTSVSTKASQSDTTVSAALQDISATYLDSICLQYRGKSLMTLGQSVKLLDTTLLYRRDPNNDYEKYSSIISNYSSSDEFYSATLRNGSITGTLNFSADSSGHIIKIKGRWKIKADLYCRTGHKVWTYLHNNYFPCLPAHFLDKQVYEPWHENFNEEFSIYASDGSNTHGHKPEWILNYSATLTNHNGL